MSRYCKQSVAPMALAAAVVAVAVVLMASTPVAAKKPGGGGGGPVLIDLHPAGSTSAEAASINHSGQIVGGSDDMAGTWDGNAAAPAFTPLPAAGLAWSRAQGQNEAGAIVGTSDLGAVYWESRTATPVVLPMPAVNFQRSPWDQFGWRDRRAGGERRRLLCSGLAGGSLGLNLWLHRPGPRPGPQRRH